MKNAVNESIVENAALDWFQQLGYSCMNGLLIAPEEPAAERESFNDVMLRGRLGDASRRPNVSIPQEAHEEALRKVLVADVPSFIGNNRVLHRMLRNGVEVKYKRPDGSIAGDRVRLIDFNNPDANDWLAVKPSTIVDRISSSSLTAYLWR